MTTATCSKAARLIAWSHSHARDLALRTASLRRPRPRDLLWWFGIGVGALVLLIPVAAMSFWATAAFMTWYWGGGPL
ncbi:MAG TPA: hypothetical protein VGJ13_05040 [Pseudonocardiaceae bacterium]|jgi:hypothetical protein